MSLDADILHSYIYTSLLFGNLKIGVLGLYSFIMCEAPFFCWKNWDSEQFELDLRSLWVYSPKELLFPRERFSALFGMWSCFNNALRNSDYTVWRRIISELEWVRRKQS